MVLINLLVCINLHVQNQPKEEQEEVETFKKVQVVLIQCMFTVLIFIIFLCCYPTSKLLTIAELIWKLNYNAQKSKDISS